MGRFLRKASNHTLKTIQVCSGMCWGKTALFSLGGVMHKCPLKGGGLLDEEACCAQKNETGPKREHTL